MSILLFILSIVLAQFSLTHAWSYRKQETWPSKCRNGIEQSPIDVITSTAKPIEDFGYVGKNWDREYNITATNDGRVYMTIDDKATLTISGGGLPGTFNLVQFHLHWHAEHKLNGERKASEAHFVTYNNKFSNMTEARNYANGLAIFSVLFNFDKNDNPLFAPIVAQVGKLKEYKSSSKLILNPRKLLPDNLTEFYRYWGSISIPGCEEGVIWTIFSQFGKISEAQISAFQTLQDRDGDPILKNHRSIQPTNGRLLTKYSTGAAVLA